jgi:hypothetical protein
MKARLKINCKSMYMKEELLIELSIYETGSLRIYITEGENRFRLATHDLGSILN